MAEANRTNLVLVENIVTFRKNASPFDVFCIPELSQKRKSTDVVFLVTLSICVVLLMGVMIYIFTSSDPRRHTHGYDNCGNVCGFENAAIEGISCSGKSMESKPLLLITDGNRECVASCGSNKVEFNRCVSKSRDSSDVYADILYCTQDENTKLTILCFIGLGLSIIALFTFRYFVKTFVWTMLIGAVLLVFGLTGFFWYMYSDASSDTKNSFLIPGIFFTIFSIFFALFILVMKSEINLIIKFYEETVKIVFAMPLILLEPVLTLLSTILIVGLFIYTLMMISTGGTLQYDHNTNKYDYISNGFMTFAVIWDILIMLWMVQFVLACQQMVISGAVASYYFARDKLALVSPIYSSFYNLVRYHLGSAAFGSLIIVMITIAKIIIRGLSRNNCACKLVYICCLRPLENLLKYMTSMGYIETAIHGQPLCRSSIRAVNLIVSNLLSAVALNSIGNFAFFMVKFLVVGITALIGYFMSLPAILVAIGAFVAFMCIHCFFVVFEIAVDTVFLCYCEDNCLNDGTNRPYYATVDLYNQIKRAQAYTKSIEEKKK